VTLEHKYVEGGDPVLLLLHGTGGGPDDLLGVARELSPSSAVLAPAGPVSEYGAARWFRRLAEGVFDHEDVVKRANQLADFVLEARETYELGDRRLVAVGFSNGANIAAAVALQRPDAIREAVSEVAGVPNLPTDSGAEHRLAWGNWGGGFGFGLPWGNFGYGGPWNNWNNWRNGWHNWHNGWGNW